MSNILYKDNRIILFADYDQLDSHRHFAKHILISNSKFLCKIDGREFTTNSVIIQSNVLHKIERISGSKIIVYLIDETSNLSKIIDKKYLKDKISVEFPKNIGNKVVLQMNQGISLKLIDKYIMEEIMYGEIINASIDERILSVMECVENFETIDKNIYNLISQEVFLSKSRFLHLFKDELGIDFKNYLLLKKMQKAYKYVIERNMNITDSAILAGFSSSSHFSSSCKKHFGISLTDFLRKQIKSSV